MTPDQTREEVLEAELHHLRRRADVPDPTERTVELLQRELANFQERTDAGFVHRAEVTQFALDAVNQRFNMTEDMRIEQKADTKAAVDAALTAQKEAVKEQTIAAALSIAKSEAATAEQLKQLNATFTAALSALDGKNSDLKDRLAGVDSDLKSRMTIIESTKAGAKDNSAAIIASVSLVLVVISVAVSLFHALG